MSWLPKDNWVVGFGHCSRGMGYIYILYMDVSKNSGTPTWMVYTGKPYEQMDDLGVPLFLETPILRSKNIHSTTTPKFQKKTYHWSNTSAGICVRVDQLRSSHLQ